MDQDAALETVRILTREVIAELNPARLDQFTDDFAAWAAQFGAPRVAEEARRYQTEPLDTTLVAGMFFRVLLDAQRLPATLPERVSFVRKEAKNYLVQHLSGQITLSRFYRLINLIEENAGQYFQRQRTGWLAPEAGPGDTPPLPAPPGVLAEELRQALAEVNLPAKGRKLARAGLTDFLLGTGGGWFRVLDLETHFRINKKTAWSCLHLLLQSGILEHNGEKANRARYALGRQFQTKP
jgi:hypothetical protein